MTGEELRLQNVRQDIRQTLTRWHRRLADESGIPAALVDELMAIAAPPAPTRRPRKDATA